MKPNWKKFSKQAFEKGQKKGYQKGYEEGRKEGEKAWGWSTVLDPPSPGQYLCKMVCESDGKYKCPLAVLEYKDGVGFVHKGGAIVTHWLRTPKPPMVYINLDHN